MRQVNAQVKGFPNRIILRVVNFSDLASEWSFDIQFLVKLNSEDDRLSLIKLYDSGVSNLGILTNDNKIFEESVVSSVFCSDDVLVAGDIVAVNDTRRYVQVLFRESDIHHTVFLTNRCNSNCLMCSQPPTPQDDSWLISEAIAIAAHMRISPKLLGFTGGEPLLLGKSFRKVFDAFQKYHPNIEFDVLTNGRMFSDPVLAKDLLEDLPNKVTWMVPLYGHTDFLHDFVVQSDGAFEQTLQGLLTLQDYKQPIQLRIVLIKPVLELLPHLSEFIGKNLPFVREVAIIGCEPTGFALANRTICEVDLSDWATELLESVTWFKRASITPVLMNIPLCALPSKLWPHAHQSISDWKRVFANECSTCEVKDNCSGLFSWYDKQWSPTKIKPIRENSL